MRHQDRSLLRERMVQYHLAPRGITEQRILDVMAEIPRELFVPPSMLEHAYEDRALAIGEGQTISQPWIVAYMTQSLELQPHEKVLEIGTGSGYQAAILGKLVREVFTIDRLESLAGEAEVVLEKLGYGNIRIFVGDGTLGLREHAPYDAIIVTAASPKVPEPLLEQLCLGGRLILPLESDFCEVLTLVTRIPGGYHSKRLVECRFVPLIGAYGYSR